jgi:hypothetical protein
MALPMLPCEAASSSDLVPLSLGCFRTGRTGRSRDDERIHCCRIGMSPRPPQVYVTPTPVLDRTMYHEPVEGR